MGFIKRYCIVCLCCLSFVVVSHAQSNRITGQFYNVKFPDFVKQAESTTIYHFYYDEAALDSFTINLQLTEETLPGSLEKIFNTNFIEDKKIKGKKRLTGYRKKWSKKLYTKKNL